jgi:hypothetical protein
MEALDMEREKNGNLLVKDDNLIIKYTKPTVETISYLSDKLTILKDGETKEYSFEEYPKVQYMGLILKAIIKDEYSSLSELFETNIKKQNIELTAKPVIDDIMSSIDIIKVKNNVKKITIYMINKDKITIETIN